MSQKHLQNLAWLVGPFWSTCSQYLKHGGSSQFTCDKRRFKYSQPYAASKRGFSLMRAATRAVSVRSSALTRAQRFPPVRQIGGIRDPDVAHCHPLLAKLNRTWKRRPHAGMEFGSTCRFGDGCDIPGRDTTARHDGRCAHSQPRPCGQSGECRELHSVRRQKSKCGLHQSQSHPPVLRINPASCRSRDGT